MEKFDNVQSTHTPTSTGLKLEELDVDEPEGDLSFRELVGSLVWLANQTRPDNSNIVRAVARCSHAPKYVRRKAVLCIFACLNLQAILLLL